MENYMEKKMQELLESQGYYTGMPVKQTPATDVLTESEEELFEALTKTQIGTAAVLAGIGVLAVVGGVGGAGMAAGNLASSIAFNPQAEALFMSGVGAAVAGVAMVLGSLIGSVNALFRNNKVLTNALNQYYPQYRQDIKRMESLAKQAQRDQGDASLKEFHRVAETFKMKMQGAADKIKVDPNITPEEKYKIAQLAEKFFNKQKKSIGRQAKQMYMKQAKDMGR